MKKTFLSLAVLTSLTLSGCASFRPDMESQAPQNYKSPVSIVDQGTQAGLDIEVAEMAKSALTIQQDTKSDPVPSVMIEKLSLNESSVFDSMQMLADAGGLSLSIAGGTKALERYGSVSMHNLSGSLESVLNKAANQIGFFWRIDDGTLVVEQERRFLMEVPPIVNDDSLSGISSIMQHLGAKDVFLDRSTRAMTFHADSKALKDIQAYVKAIRNGRSMIVFDINIWQVDLTDGNTKGINWDLFNVANLTKTANPINLVNAVTSTSPGLNILMSSNEFSASTVVSFMETQGTVKTISQPRIAVMNGAAGKITVGNNLVYISKISTNYSTSLNSVSTETSNLATGVSLSVMGDFHDGTVYTQLALDINDLVQMNTFVASGVSMQLPSTTKRQLETLGRIPPGSTMLLGGITIARDSFNWSGGIASWSKDKNTTRSELVLAIRPKVVTFSAPK